MIPPITLADEEEVESDIPFTIVEDMPEFPGGDAALISYIAKNTQYPEVPKELGISGKVFIQFLVDKNGHVKNITVIRGVDPALDAEAVRVITSLPDFTPGKQRGIPVDVQLVVPINFTLKY